MNRIGRRLFAALLFFGMAAGIAGAVAAADTFPAGDHPPGEEEVQDWADRVKSFRETLLTGENGRFAAVRIDGSSVFLLDTQKGHLWFWTFGEKGSFIAYQGQLLPGLKMGDIVGASAGLWEAVQEKNGNK